MRRPRGSDVVSEEALHEQGILTGKHLRHVGSDGNGGLTNREQLVDESTTNDEEKTNRPCSEGTDGSVWVISVVDDGSDLCVGGILGDENGFELHLSNELLVVLGVFKNFWLVDEYLDVLKDTMREVLVVLVHDVDFFHNCNGGLQVHIAKFGFSLLEILVRDSHVAVKLLVALS